MHRKKTKAKYCGVCRGPHHPHVRRGVPDRLLEIARAQHDFDDREIARVEREGAPYWARRGRR